MANKKKRVKKHQKQQQQAARPVLTRISAVKRNPAHQWWVDHQRLAKPILFGLLIFIAVVILIVGLVGLFV